MEQKEIRLGFDAQGSYVGFKADDENTHHDVMGKLYRQCTSCHQWKLASEWPVSKKTGEPTKLCQQCLDYKAKYNQKTGKPASKPETLNLGSATNEALIDELRNRGFQGKLTLTTKYEL